MKTKNIKRPIETSSGYGLSRFKRRLLLSVALFLAMFHVACNKSSSSNPQPVMAPMVQPLGGGMSPGCSNCIATPGFLVSTDSTGYSGGGVTLSLDFYGDINRGINFQNPQAPVYYKGPIQAKGQLIINAQDPMLCNAMPGSYMVQTLQPGMYALGAIGSASGTGGNLRLEAIGNGGGMILTMVQGVVSYPGTYNVGGTILVGPNNLSPNRLGATLAIVSVNGQPCSFYGTGGLFLN